MAKQLHIISTGKQSMNEFIQKVELIHPYIDFLHLRERKWTAKDYISVIEKLTKLGVQKEKMIINDRIDIAAATGVGGVQLASHSIDASYVEKYYPQFRIGCSVHDVNEAVLRERAGAHFLLYGHIFATTSKPGVAPRGVGKLQQVVESVNIPVIAIGGIKHNNIKSIRRTGAKGVAVLSGVLLADNVKRAVKQFREALKEGEQ